ARCPWRRRVSPARSISDRASIRREIADGGEAGTDDGRIGRRVDDLVDLAGDEAVVEMNRLWIDEAPPGRWDGAPRRHRCVALGQNRVLRIGGRIAETADVALDHVRDGMIEGLRADDEVAPHAPADPLRHRRIEM